MTVGASTKAILSKIAKVHEKPLLSDGFDRVDLFLHKPGDQVKPPLLSYRCADLFMCESSSSYHNAGKVYFINGSITDDTAINTTQKEGQ